MVTTKEFANVLRQIENDTPQTTAFEEERDESNERKYAQKSDRWWDKNTATQKEHIVCWFARKYYTKGSTKECIIENCCMDCYFEINNQFPLCGHSKNAETVFNFMKKPEMYLWIAEALKVITPEDLEKCISELKEVMDENPKKWKGIIKNYINWEMVENKIT